METPDFSEPGFTRLIKKAYTLADALASTREIQAVFLEKKSLAFEEWSRAVYRLLIETDVQILKTCGVPLFQTGLHGRMILPERPSSQAVPGALPEELREAANQIGRELCQVVKRDDQRQQEGNHLQSEELSGSEAASKYTKSLCAYLVSLIFNDLGLRPDDFSDLY